MFKIFNLHFTDCCNFQCKCCFVKKSARFLSLEKTKIVIDKISSYFKLKNINDGRINIAGGEPLTSSYIQEIIDYIISKNIRVSIITNGFLLTDDFIKNNKGKLEMIGISIDSIIPSTNLLLGRCQGNATFEYNRLVHLCKLIKENNIFCKINIVVSKINYHEDIKKLLDDVKPDRFKILQMLPTNEFAISQKITVEDYSKYLEKYDGYNYVAESFDKISNAYVIIDSEGKISTNNLHDGSFDVLEGEIADFEHLIDFNQENESIRYIK